MSHDFIESIRDVVAREISVCLDRTVLNFGSELDGWVREIVEQEVERGIDACVRSVYSMTSEQTDTLTQNILLELEKKTSNHLCSTTKNVLCGIRHSTDAIIRDNVKLYETVTANLVDPLKGTCKNLDKMATALTKISKKRKRE